MKLSGIGCTFVYRFTMTDQLKTHLKRFSITYINLYNHLMLTQHLMPSSTRSIVHQEMHILARLSLRLANGPIEHRSVQELNISLCTLMALPSLPFINDLNDLRFFLHEEFMECNTPILI